jgi:hypothetical protein
METMCPIQRASALALSYSAYMMIAARISQLTSICAVREALELSSNGHRAMNHSQDVTFDGLTNHMTVPETFASVRHEVQPLKPGL